MKLINLFRKKNKKPIWYSKLPKEMVEFVLGEIKRNPQACNTDEIPQGRGEFGLESSNPIPINGVPSSEIYLRSLQTQDFKVLQWNRIGSVGSDNISKPIDKYEIMDINGVFICHLYMSPYHWKTSSKCPEGFVFK